jgi:hypothetical protein
VGTSTSGLGAEAQAAWVAAGERSVFKG